MKKFHFKKIDAFTDGSSGGNPAGYIDLTEGAGLSAAEMQQIAAELKGFVNEVGFLSREAGQYRLRYYSSECEVAFCGHATIAILYDLLRSTPALQNEPEVRVRVNAGELPVYNHLAEMNAVFITAPAAQFLPCRPSGARETAEILGIDAQQINGALPLRVIDGGLRTLIVPLDGVEHLSGSASGCGGAAIVLRTERGGHPARLDGNVRDARRAVPYACVRAQIRLPGRPGHRLGQRRLWVLPDRTEAVDWGRHSGAGTQPRESQLR